MKNIKIPNNNDAAYLNFLNDCRVPMILLDAFAICNMYPLTVMPRPV